MFIAFVKAKIGHLMNEIVTIEKSINSCYDFELQIERKTPLSFSYSYKKNTELKGIVFIISGFGGDTNSGYLDNLRTYTAKTFDVVCVNVFYHCFYSRPNNGAKLSPDEIDKTFIKKYFDNYGIEHNNYNIDAALHQLDAKIEELKKNGKLAQHAKVVVPATTFPANDEYQNFGVIQALDHINVLQFIQNKHLRFKKDYSTTLVGSSHGGYIAHLCAKFAPSSIDLVIDNSSYAKPPYKYFLGRESNSQSPEYTIDYKSHIKIYSFVKTHWSLDKNSKNFFSNDHFRIRDISDNEHLTKLSKMQAKKTKYISYHSAYDVIAPINEKEEFYKTLNSLGFDATLHIINDESLVDGKFIKNLGHGLNMSIKELINRELPKMDMLESINNRKIEKISFDCDAIKYIFDFKDDVFCGQITPLKTEDIEEIAKETFLKNISYFEKNQHNIFKKLSALDSAIEQNYYQNRYNLILKDSYFDVLELSSNNHLYSANSKYYAETAAKAIDFTQNSNAFETFKHIKVNDDELKKFEACEIADSSLSGFAPILHYIDNNSPKECRLDSIKKFIFFGVGLGTHLAAIDKKINADVYFIVEDDLELFRLSLFTVPYYKLSSNAKLVFSVLDTQEEFDKNTTEFLEKAFYYNHYIKYFHMLSHNEEKLKEFHVKVASQSHIVFYYSEILKQFTRPLKYLKSGFNFTNIIRLHSTQALGSKPVLLLAAGSSLQKNIAWVKENQERFVIIALSATLGLLENNQISPDIVTHIDGLKYISADFKKLISMDFLKDTTFLISARTSNEIVEMLNKNNIFLFENGTSYKKDFGDINTPCAGSSTYLLAAIFGIKELYLLGLDLALDYETDSIDSINTTTQNYKSSEQNVYNVSNGVLYKNTISLDLNKLDSSCFKKMDKALIKKELHNIFATNSSNKTTPDELKSLKDKKNHSLKIKEIILSQEKSKFTSDKDFLDSLISLFKKLSTSSSSIDDDLALIYKEYSKFIYTFIFHFFNIKELNEKNIHASQLNKLLCKELLRIVNSYMKEL